MAEPVRRLTAAGIQQFRDYLEELREGRTLTPPRSLLRIEETSEPVSPVRSVEGRAFATRLEAARYLTEALYGLPRVEEDVGLWSWLSLFYFDQVCPARPDGVRFPGRDYRHIPEPDYRYAHRHLLGGPFVVYRLHGEQAALLLGTPAYRENSFHHELASRQAFISNPTIIGAVNLLYLDERTRGPKRQAQDPKHGPGTLRRFIDVVQQIDLNYDLYSMTAEAMVGLLPAEFDEWKRKKRSWFRARRSAS